MTKNEIIEEIRNIIGNKKFTFSDAYINQCKGKLPIVGRNERQYNAITKKYLYIECYGVYVYNDLTDEHGYDFRRYPLTKSLYGEYLHKVKLEDMFTKDLQRVLDDLKFYLWWETCYRLPRIEKEYAECLKYKEMYNKINVE